MVKGIGVSTGIFHKFYLDKGLNKRISHISRWDVDYVEILFSRLYMLDIPITPKNKEFLSKKKVILHAPFFQNEGYDFCTLGKEEIKKLIDMAKELKAEYIIVHPDLLYDISILNEFDFPFVLENQKVNRDFRLEKLHEIFAKYPKLKLALDLGHAENLTHEEIHENLEELGNLTEIHFPIKDVDKFLNEEHSGLEYLKDCNAVIILESKMDYLDMVPQVLEKLRRIF